MKPIRIWIFFKLWGTDCTKSRLGKQKEMGLYGQLLSRCLPIEELTGKDCTKWRLRKQEEMGLYGQLLGHCLPNWGFNGEGLYKMKTWKIRRDGSLW